ncbi:hypothetical protein SBA2_300013 [Acidobacteriia bacterium SbA2]|nr:hypothetical protein SBA2_300013 [Acidobacteriia bacterium SbA2]
MRRRAEPFVRGYVCHINPVRLEAIATRPKPNPCGTPCRTWDPSRPGDHNGLGCLLVAGEVEGRVEDALEARDQALVIPAVLGQAEGFKDGGGGAKADFAVLCQVATEAIQIRSRRSWPKGRP